MIGKYILLLQNLNNVRGSKRKSLKEAGIEEKNHIKINFKT